MNKLNHIAQVFRRILKIVFSQVPERFFAHSLAQFGSDIPSIRQVTHWKPPFYSSSTKRFSCRCLITGPVAEALHERDTVNLRESILYSGQVKVAVEGTTDAIQELQAAETLLFWITTSEGTPQKRPNYKGTLEASQPRWLPHHA